MRVIEDIEYGEGETGEGGIKREKAKAKWGKGGGEYQGKKERKRHCNLQTADPHAALRKKGILDFGIMLQKPFEG